MDKSTRRQNIFFHNLLALGFDVAETTKQYKITFDKKMFCLPNRKGFEIVFNFLLLKLSEVSKEKYSIIWPLADNKDRTQFQKTAFTYLVEIAKQSGIKFPLVLNSVFSSFGGEAFCDLLFAFSTHVVQRVNQTFGPMLQRPRPDNKLTKHAIECLKLSSMSSVDRFKAYTDSTRICLEACFDVAKKLTDGIERVKISNATNQSMLNEKIKKIIPILSTENISYQNNLEGLVLKSREHQKQVEALWERLDNFLSKDEKWWNFISSELEEDTVKPILRGSAYEFLPSNKLKKSYEEIYETELTEENDSFCMQRSLKFLKLALESYSDSIQRGKFSETYQCQSLKNISELDSTLKEMQTLCSLLDESNIVHRNQLEALLENIKLDDFIEDKMDFVADLPPSPNRCSKFSVDLEQELINFNLDHEAKNTTLPEMENRQNQTILYISVNDIGISPMAPAEVGSVLSLNDEMSHQNATPKTDEENDSEISQLILNQGDLISNPDEFEIPQSWLQEESLNSQTLSDGASFLD